MATSCVRGPGPVTGHQVIIPHLINEMIIITGLISVINLHTISSAHHWCDVVTWTHEERAVSGVTKPRVMFITDLVTGGWCG